MEDRADRRIGAPVTTGDAPARQAGHGSEALLVLLAAAAATVVAAALLSAALDLSAHFVPRTALLALLTAGVIRWLERTRLAPRPFGVANRVTTIRALGVALLAAFVGESGGPAVAWTVVALAIAMLILDGVDGRLARRSGLASAFGARFDMETDAALTLVLAVLCWQFGKAGEWILAVGLMRYGFVAAAWMLPWIGRPLPYSRRRQTICVVQLSGLLAVISPLFPVPLSTAVGLATLLLLTASFAVDVDWLARERPNYG